MPGPHEYVVRYDMLRQLKLSADKHHSKETKGKFINKHRKKNTTEKTERKERTEKPKRKKQKNLQRQKEERKKNKKNRKKHNMFFFLTEGKKKEASLTYGSARRKLMTPARSWASAFCTARSPSSPAGTRQPCTSGSGTALVDKEG